MFNSREKRKKPKTCVFFFSPFISFSRKKKQPPSPGGLYEETLLEMAGLRAAGPAGDTWSMMRPESRAGSTGKHMEAHQPRAARGGAPAQPMTSSDTAPLAGHAARPAQ